MRSASERRPLISIVVNNYNYERFLPQAIDSALAQNYERTEVIVVDDGSTDGSRAVIAGYAGSVVPVLKQNGGQASAFNAGFAASSGDMVVFLDADDYLFPSVAERVASLYSPGVACVQYRLQTVDDAGVPTGFKPGAGLRMEDGEVWRSLLTRGSRCHPPTSGNAFSREALQGILPVPEEEWRISADGYLLTLAPFEGLVVSVEEALGAYRIHGDNLWIRRGWRNGERLVSQVRYDLRKHALISRKANELGHDVPADLGLRDHRRVQYRLASLRLRPTEHPVETDTARSLLYRGLHALRHYSGLPRRRQALLGAWFVCAGMAPLPVASLVIYWTLASGSRPQLLGLSRGFVASIRPGARTARTTGTA